MANVTVDTSLPITVRRVQASDWRLVSDRKTAYGKTYEGEAEQCTVIWSIGVVTGIQAVDDWARNQVISDVESGLAQRGGKLLRIQVFNELSPSSLFQTMEPFDWKLVIDADVTGETSGSASTASMRSPFPWSFVISLALVAIALLLLKWTIDSVTTLVYGPGGGGGIAMGGILLLGGLVLAAMAMAKSKSKSKKPSSVRKASK